MPELFPVEEDPIRMRSSVPAFGSTSTLGVLELGTNSLKLHLSGAAETEPLRREWDVGFEVFRARRISEETIEEAIAQARAALERQGIDPAGTPVVGIATGAFREAENASDLLNALYQKTGIPVQVLSVEEEAHLLTEGVRDRILERPAMAFDLGGGALEVIHLGGNGGALRQNLRLGANWLYHLARFASGEWDERQAVKWIETVLLDARPFRMPAIHGTGGTVRAITQVAGTDSIDVESLRAIEERARKDGGPAELSPRRRLLFLPGVMIVRRLVEHVDARVLHYVPVDLGEVLLGLLRPFQGALQAPLGRSFLLQHLELFLRGARPAVPPRGTSLEADQDRSVERPVVTAPEPGSLRKTARTAPVA